MKSPLFIAVISISFIQCSNANNQTEFDQKSQFDSRVDTCNYVSMNEINPKCPHGHTDSIIPIIYGFPSEESFARSDSGLVSLGGCEISDCDPYWWCKIHEIGF